MRLVLAILVLAAAWTANAQGTFEAIVSHAGPYAGTTTGATVGWTFQPTDWMEVRDLGCFTKVFTENQFATSIQVGLWATGGVLLASSSITPASTLFNESFYESITPVSLDAGQVYHIGAWCPDIDISVEIGGPALGGSVSMSTNLLLRAMAENTANFGFPPEIFGTEGRAYLVPNFRWGVPEPSSALLLGLAALLLVARCRRRLL